MAMAFSFVRNGHDCSTSRFEREICMISCRLNQCAKLKQMYNFYISSSAPADVTSNQLRHIVVRHLIAIPLPRNILVASDPLSQLTLA